MPLKAGGSHAFASFATLVVGSLLSKYVWTLAPPLGEASVAVAGFVATLTGGAFPADRQFAATVLLVVGLSFGWGVGYHLSRH